ncbi:hypothetical protein MUP77_14840 [Candidatus Bathyarchaeota archaeon]|nr:hypothetical protein [Candidatus Bathyarchaeota archaeon]
MIDWNGVELELRKLNFQKIYFKYLDPKGLEEIKNRSDQGTLNFAIAQKLLKHIQWPSLTPSEDTLLKLTYILFLVEGPFGFYINNYVFGLVLESHHDVWLEDKQKFASSFEEIINVPLSTKLKFLDKHDFKSFSKICPKDIRNAIAHWNFHIEADGTITIKNHKYTKEDSTNIVLDIDKLLDLLFKHFKANT